MPLITRAGPEDAGDIMGLINQCITKMESEGIYQWNAHYPTLDIIMDDIESKAMYVLKHDNTISGIVAISELQPPEYKNLTWICDKGKVLVIHRLAVRPEIQGLGIGKTLLAFAENQAKEHEYSSIRLDAYIGNPAAVKLYEDRGYIRVGQISFPMRFLPFNCYEKIPLRKGVAQEASLALRRHR